MTMADLATLEDECQQRVNEVQVLKEKGSQRLLRVYPIRENSCTGLTCMKVLLAVFNLVSSALPMTNGRSKLPHFECFTFTLMKLRLNLSNYDLAFRSSVLESTVGRVFSKWIKLMDIRLSQLIKWPDRGELQKTMLFCFRCFKVISIIDCFELFIEKRSNLLAKSCMWSLYKHYNTAKYLISVTPQGSVSFPFATWRLHHLKAFQMKPFQPLLSQQTMSSPLGCLQ